MTLLIFYVAIALVVSFLCSILESSLLTLTPSTIQAGKSRGEKWAETLERLKKDIDRPLAAILTLNTVAHTMGAAGAGAQYARLYGNATEALFAAALTVAVLIITEIIPKTMGARYAVALAPFTAAILPVLVVALAPLVWFSKQLTKLITLGKPPREAQHRDDLLATAHLGHEAGQLRRRETEFLRNMLHLHAVKASDIMTPRPVMFSLPVAMQSNAFIGAVEEKPYTRIPLYGEMLDDVQGFVIRGEVLMEHVKNGSFPISKVIRPIETTLNSVPVDQLFQRMVSEGHQIMLVVDEYGSVTGLVTLEDVVETVFGFEIVDEADQIPDLQAYARDLWRQRTERTATAGSYVTSTPSAPNSTPTEKRVQSGTADARRTTV